ncbi:MAG TPA: hypothetical protein PKW90_10455, partial [Myxococcota bacterium]|nr:hypothetical protein [Myxococcota bacterium]
MIELLGLSEHAVAPESLDQAAIARLPLRIDCQHAVGDKAQILFGGAAETRQFQQDGARGGEEALAQRRAFDGQPMLEGIRGLTDAVQQFAAKQQQAAQRLFRRARTAGDLEQVEIDQRCAMTQRHRLCIGFDKVA